MSINIKSPHEYINATVVGTPKISEGVVSGFTTSSYLQIPEIFDVTDGSNWEMVSKIRTGTDISNAQYFISGITSQSCTVYVQNSCFGIGLSSANGSWNITDGTKGTYVVLPETEYWLKLTFNGSSYILSYSLDGVEYVSDITKESTSSVYGGVTLGLGISRTLAESFSGSIDLTQSYIKINGEYWWRGVEVDQYKEIKRLYQYKEPTYYKYGTEIDATVTGSFGQINKGVASGFSASNYLNTPESFNVTGKQTWEEVFKITTSSDVISAQNIVGCNTATTGCVLQFGDSNFRLYLSSGSSSWNIAKGVAGTYTLLPDTTYWFKIEFTGTAYIVSYSLNGVDYIQDIMVSSSTPISSNKLRIGSTSGATTENFGGSIDLTQSYININGERWWSGDAYTKVGSWIDDGVVSGFSTSNYLKLPTEMNVSDGSSWEMVFKIKTGSSFSTHEIILGKPSNTNYFTMFSLTRGVITLWLSNNNTSFFVNATGTTTLELETTYYVKAEFTGSEYNVYLSQNGTEWTLEGTVKSSTVYTNSTFSRIGYGADTGAGYPFNGLIDLTQSYIKINDKLWWHGTKVEETTADDYEWLEKKPMLIKQVYKTDKTKYFKYGTEPNATVTGNFAKLDKGVASGFSASNYLTVPLTPSVLAAANNWEVVTCFTTNSSGAGCCLMGGSGTYAPDFGRVKNNKFALAYSSNGSSYNITGVDGLTGTHDVLPNTKYWVRQKFTGSEYTLEYSLDGEIYILDISKASSVKIESTSDTMYCGYSPVRTTVHNSIDLTQSYIKINNELWWSGDSYTKVGSWIDDGVVSRFTSTNYLTFDIGTTMTSDLVEAVISFNTGTWSDTSSKACGVLGGDAFPLIQIYNQKSNLGGANNTGSYTYNTNEDVTWKVQIQNGTCNVYRLDTSGEYILDLTFTYSTAISGTVRIGYNSSTRYLNGGSVNLNNCYVNVNGEKRWHGTKAEEVTAVDDFDYSAVIPQLVYEHNPTVFQQSTAGTYTFNVTEEAPYEITLVGGGGGGAFNSSGNAGSAAAGNSGSGLVVNAVLKAGTYVLNVGAGGAWSGWLDANTWGGNGSQSSISKDGVVLATAGGGTGNHAWWRSGSAHNSTVGAAPTYTDELGVRDVILNRQGNWGGLAATSSGGASVISGTTWGKGGDTRNRNAADNGNAGCIRIVRLEK